MYQDGPRGEFNVLYSVSVTEGGSFVLVGGCEGYWSRDSAGFLDFFAVKLDTDSNELWRWQVRKSCSHIQANIQRIHCILQGAYGVNTCNLKRTKAAAGLIV